jgi:hypothetical protein
MEGRETHSQAGCIIRWNEGGIYNAWPVIVVSDADDGKENKATSSVTVYHAKSRDGIQVLKP